MQPPSSATSAAAGTPRDARESLRRRLALLAVVSIAPMMLLFVAQGFADYRAERVRTGQHQLDVARSMAATVERELGGVVASLQVLALSPRLQQGDLVGFRELAMRFIVSQPEGSSLVLLAASGQQLVNTRLPPDAALPQRKPAVNAALTEQVFATGRPVISDLFPRTLGSVLIVTAEAPVLRDGHVVYDVALVLPASRFRRIIAEQHLESGTISSIFDGNGLHIARVPGPQDYSGSAAPARLQQALLASDEGVITSTSMEGLPLLTAFSHTHMSRWSVTIGVPESVLRDRLRASLAGLLVAGVLGLVCSLGLAALLARRVLVPMRALAQLASDPSLPVPQGALGLREMDEVAVALRQSLAERQAALEAVQQLNESLEARVRHEIRNREQVQSQLAQSQRMEALGQLAGGIAHDFNNVLQAVTGGLSLIQRRADDPDSVRRLSGLATDAAERGAAITGRLLTFARRSELKAIAIDPLQLLDSLRDMLAYTLGGGIDVEVEAQAGMPSLLADRAQLETVLVNLAVNARDAMPDGGLLTLRATALDVEPARDHQVPGLAAGAYVALDVIDTGTGMPAATLARASEPFFTTKPPGQGTGLGLAMARGFAEQSGGALRIRSADQRGTTITLWFPQSAADMAAAAPPAPAADNAALPPMHLLMVDDDSMVREVLAHELEDRGFLVTTTTDGLAALKLLDGGQPADLLVSDYAMPGMNGLALIEAARRRRPELPALLLTGYAEAEAGLPGVEDHLTVVLRKPVSGEELAARATALGRR